MISAKKKRIVDVKESTRKPTGEYESSLNPHTSGIDPSFVVGNRFVCVTQLVRPVRRTSIHIANVNFMFPPRVRLYWLVWWLRSKRALPYFHTRRRTMMKELELCKAFMLIEPGPVVLVTTRSGRKNNIMTITWTSVLDFTPHFALVTGPWNYSYEALMKTKQCVLAIPTADMAETAVSIGDCSGSDTDKFKKFGLTAVKGKCVKAPLIRECLANIECEVVDYIEGHGIFILDGVQAWIDPKRKERRTLHANGDGTFIVDGRILNLRKFMADKIPPGV